MVSLMQYKQFHGVLISPFTVREEPSLKITLAPLVCISWVGETLRLMSSQEKVVSSCSRDEFRLGTSKVLEIAGLMPMNRKVVYPTGITHVCAGQLLLLTRLGLDYLPSPFGYS